jgi:hypothetical protein
MELFGRLARRSGDVDKLMERAAQYIDPAEAAVASLVANSERLSRYLASAAPPETQTLSLDELMSEMTSLLRASKRRLQVTTTLPEPLPAVRADRMRLCHVLLHTCLSNPASAVAIYVRTATGLVTIDLAFQAGASSDAARAAALSVEELRLIVETGGGALVAASEAARQLEFRQATDPRPG